MKPELVFKRSVMFFVYDLSLFVFFYLTDIKCLVLSMFFVICVHLFKYIGTRFTIGSEFVSLNSGVLANSSQDIPFNKISSVSVKQGLLGQLFQYGDVGIFTGNDTHGIWVNNIQDPMVIKEIVNERTLSRSK